MEKKKDSYKIILACDKQAIIQQIYLDSGALLESIKLPLGLHGVIAPFSISALGSFWLSIQQNFMAENTLLTLIYQDKQITFLFSGYLMDETILLCGSTELPPAEKVLGEIMMINNEQANQIRITEKKVLSNLNETGRNELNESFLNDFTALNNDLINNKRELMRQNKKNEILNKELNDAYENISMFTYSVSHDLKEPVRMMKSFLTLFHKKYGESLDQKGGEYIDFALDGANRLSKMIADLLEYHRASNVGMTETVDLNDVLLEVKYILQNEIAVKNALISSNNLPVIKGSFAGYRQVFQNLISNAIKFVPEGKVPIISIHSLEDEIKYTLQIKDNGIGIAENQKQDVFKLFKRLNTQQEYEGTGMGLAMVRKSMERMGGAIELESEEGEGSTFILSIRKEAV